MDFPTLARVEPNAASFNFAARGPVGSSLKLTYAITPPNQTTPIERRAALAARQSEAIAALAIDALLVYDLQDETARNNTPRPFPFIPKVDALSYAFGELRLGDLPRIVYRAIADQREATLRAWVERLAACGGRAVFVGAPSRDSGVSLTLSQAVRVCRSHEPGLPFGGVLIAERHEKSGDEDSRVWAKVQQGCSFFVSQTMWSADATKTLLRDLKTQAERAGSPLPTILLTLSPCGSEQTLAFQDWLGVGVPAAIKRELLLAKDMLERSIELSAAVFAEVQSFAAQHGIAVGCNVESVSTRAAEVAASIELLRRIERIQGSPRLERGVMGL